MLSVRHTALTLLGLLALPFGAFADNVPPKSLATIPAATLYAGATAEVIDLSQYFTDPDTIGIRLTTVLGSIDVALYNQETPLTVANFLNYVDTGAYLITDPTTNLPAPVFFHRSVPGFVIQTGGYLATSDPDSAGILQPTTVVPFAPVPNEPGISNIRGTMAMAKLDGAADSATSQFFINLVDNSSTLDTENGGFTVFGRVLGNGMDVADAIAALPIFDFFSPFDTIPLINYTADDFNAKTPAAPADAVTVPSITRTLPLTFTTSSSNTGVATAVVSDANLLVTPVAAGSSTITITATDADGASVSQSFVVTITSTPPHLANLSTRVEVGANQDALIGGFIVLGDSPKLVGIRALGPSLTALGVDGALADPRLELHDGDGNLVASNDNWQDAPNEQEIIDLHLAPTQPNESVILRTLPATSTGSVYTAVVYGVNGSTGTGLVEIYDLGSGPGSNVLNISTRGNVQQGNNVMIGGFIVLGDDNQNVLVRALGPSLSSQGISNPLADPTLTLVNSQGVVVDANDDWQDNPSKAAIEASNVAPTNAKEAAVIDTLVPDSYTAIVRGAGAAVGTALVEIYALPNDD